MSQVVLNPAYVWCCPECGHESFERGMALDLPPEELEAHMQDYGIEPGAEGDFVIMPEEVSCKHCNLTFATVHY